MSKMNANHIASRLRLSTSSLVVAACLGMVANAQVVPLTAGTSPFMIDNSPGQTVRITSGTDAVELPAGQTWILGPGNTWEGHLALTDENWGVAPGWGANNMTIGASPFGGANPNAALIQVDSGASLRFLGNQSLGWGPWFGMNNMIQAQGDVIFENMSANIVGTNTFAGNVTLLDGANIYMGETWGAPSAISFSNNTNITLNTGSMLYLRLPSAFTSTAGTLRGPGALELASGKLVVNGVNTLAAPFVGGLTLDSGSIFMVGDSAHTGAIFGDPNHTDGSSYTLNVNGTISGSATLQGYGKVYGTVINAGGVVQPGGTAGTLGTLTVSRYTQDGTGALWVEVSPTSNSQLHVLGNATLNGSLRVTIDPGAYGTNVYNIVTVDGTMTGQFSTLSVASGATGAIAAVTQNAHGYQVVTEVVAGPNAAAPVLGGHLISSNRLNNNEFIASLYDVIAMNSPNSGAIQKAALAQNVYAWVAPFGRVAGISRDGTAYHTTAEGVTGGFEARTSGDTTLGIAASYSHEALKSKGASSADSDTFDVALYGGATLQYVRIDGVAFYNIYSSEMSRNFGSNGVATAKPSGYAYGGSFQVSKSLFHDLVTPYIRGTYSRQHLDAASETGATVLDLHFDAINTNTFVGDIGLRINPLFRMPDANMKFELTVAVEHDFSKPGELVTGEFPIGSGTEFNTFWKGDSENSLVAAVDASRHVSDHIEVFGRLYGRLSQFETAGEISIGGRYKF